jgi:hypothetical protein
MTRLDYAPRERRIHINLETIKRGIATFVLSAFAMFVPTVLVVEIIRWVLA